MNLFVAAQRVVELPLGFRKGRWIEQDEIVARFGAFHLFEFVKNIGFTRLDLEFVSKRIARDQRRSLFADLDRYDLRRTRFCTRERESTLIRETIQHAPTRRVLGDISIICALIEVKAGLLSVEKINFKFHAADLNHER